MVKTKETGGKGDRTRTTVGKQKPGGCASSQENYEVIKPTGHWEMIWGDSGQGRLKKRGEGRL